MSGPIVDDTSGEVLLGQGEDCPRCEAERTRADAILGDLHRTERRRRYAERRIDELKEQLDAQRFQTPEHETVVRLFRHWRVTMGRDPKRTKLGEKRERAVLGRLRDGYDETYIRRAIEGAKRIAYTNPRTGVRYDDLELICRNEVNLERFYAAGVVESAR